jgi:hypothetical protein
MFTYETSLATSKDRVRFQIGDTDPEAGPRPDSKTFSNEEIEAVIALEGTWQRAVAALFEVLAAEWRQHPTFSADQYSISNSHISRGYRDEADAWRKQYGYAGEPVAAGGSKVKSVSPVRVDAYSDDLTISGQDD